jgi:hypothetical protein
LPICHIWHITTSGELKGGNEVGSFYRATAEFWINLQKIYELSLAKEEDIKAHRTAKGMRLYPPDDGEAFHNALTQSNGVRTAGEIRVGRCQLNRQSSPGDHSAPMDVKRISEPAGNI